MNSKVFKNDVSIVICGEAGQGIKTIENILVHIFKKNNFNIFSSKEYMSRIRGGSNSTIIRISDKKVCSQIKRIDIFIPFDKNAIEHLKNRITENTIIIGEIEDKDNTYNIINISFTKIAEELGSKIYSNIVVCGFIQGLFANNVQVLLDYLNDFFKKKSTEIIKKNIEAAKKGYELGKNIYDENKIKIEITKDIKVKNNYFLNGASAIGLGAIRAGCNFISSYPMSPSTGVLTFLANYSEKFGIVVEQAEDEISAINMAIGAWYAGARAMVTTSGGGFALMTEGISLAGIIESPMVIHLAQRPGPATGLPTRTEQGDLELALYAGHGEFPRIIFAPNSLEDAFYTTYNAFNLADKFQVPVIILTDQYLIDSYYNIDELDHISKKIEKNIIKTDESYKRYRFTDNGISPRGIPGFGNGMVKVDSDEHDETGHITESENVRIKMVDKRLKKMDQLKLEVNKPVFIGKEKYKYLIIGWGSTFHIIKDAVNTINNPDIAILHFNQIYPVYEGIMDYLKKAEEVIIIEGNATAQFAKLIKIYSGFSIKHKILKYSGMQFFVEELVENISNLLKEIKS